MIDIDSNDKKEDSVGWALFTCLIPGVLFVWHFRINKPLKTRDPNAPSSYLALAFPVLFVLTIIAIISGYIPPGVVVACVMLFGGIASFVYLVKLSQSVHRISKGKTSSGLIFIVFLVFAPLAVYLVQEVLNNTPNRLIVEES
ncbi:hypothetical protein KC867_00225 [Candidatus Saccharibacteria bacterium]|nr:hypothetical protein [Candidatus Saccharibacteria bacterium]